MDLFAVNVKNTTTFSLKPISGTLAKTTRRFSSSPPFGAELLRLLEIRLSRPKVYSTASASRSFLVTAVAKKNHDNSPSPGTYFLPKFFNSWDSIVPSFLLFFLFRLLSRFGFRVSFDIFLELPYLAFCSAWELSM